LVCRHPFREQRTASVSSACKSKTENLSAAGVAESKSGNGNDPGHEICEIRRGSSSSNSDPSFFEDSRVGFCALYMKEAKSHRLRDLPCLSVRDSRCQDSCGCAYCSFFFTTTTGKPRMRLSHVPELYSARRSFLNMDSGASIVAAQSRLLRLCRSPMTPFALGPVDVDVHNILNVLDLPSSSRISWLYMT
jgi:hypothetical protein